MTTARNLTQCIAVLYLLSAGAVPAQKIHRNPFVGNVTDTSATIAVWLETAGSFGLEYGQASDLSGGVHTAPATVSAVDDFTAKVNLRGLLPATRYYYRLTDAAGASPASPVQSFKTFPKQGADAPFTLLFGSCQQKTEADSGRVFSAARNFGGDLFVQLGDWTYSDSRVAGYPATDSGVRASYELRLDTMYAFSRLMLSQMGLAYSWDDNDYARNNSDGSADSLVKSRLLGAYKRHVPHYPLANPANGIWHSFRIGNAEVFMIDSRSQRRPNAEAFQGGKFAPPAGHSMLAGYPVTGTDQRTWLLDAIRSSKARWKILVSPVWFNPSTDTLVKLALLLGQQSLADEVVDKWVGFPADVDSMKALFRYSRNLIILSGDAHVNVFDNGSHSVVPEFMVGNLDNVASSNPFALAQTLGLNLWTGMQSGGRRTIGRLRVETAPRHRLIVESFDEDGAGMLSYEMVDGADGVNDVPPVPGGILRVLSSWCGEDRTLHLKCSRPLSARGRLALYSVAGVPVLDQAVESADGQITLEIPAGLSAGMYLGRLAGDGGTVVFRVIVAR